MSSKKEGAAIVGAAACAACCAGPILGFLGAIGLGTFTGVLLFGVAGLLIAAVGAAIVMSRRRRRAITCMTAPEIGAVEMPIIRTR